jgi:hypothetical protein
MINSKYAPINIAEYGAKDLNANFQGTKFSSFPSTSTTHDFKVDDDHILDGCEISAIGQIALGDYFIGQVVDKDNILGFGAGVILNQFVPKWFLVPGVIRQLDFSSRYPAKILNGLYLRIIYVSTGLTPVDVIVNYKLHKILW